jgi:hypothetical protein
MAWREAKKQKQTKTKANDRNPGLVAALTGRVLVGKEAPRDEKSVAASDFTRGRDKKTKTKKH